jgi:hypothetical protein
MKTRHGKYKVPRTKISVEKGPPSIAESCEINIQHSYITKRRSGTTRLPEKVLQKMEEGECYLDEEKPPKWMEAEIKTKEFDISNDDHPKMV